MSSCNRRQFLRLGAAGLGLPALAACGFTPAYGPGGPGRALQGQVQIADPETPQGYRLLQRLEDRLGAGGPAAPYALELSLSQSRRGLGETSDGRTTRYNLVGELDYRLRRGPQGPVVASGSTRSFTGYSATGSTVATLAAQRDAEERLMIILADQLVDRLLLDLAALA